MTFNFNIGGITQQNKSNNLGGPFVGYSPQQTITNFKDSSQVMTRKILVKSWNKEGINGFMKGRGRITTPFRSVNSMGDYLGRVNYACGGSVENNHLWVPGGRRSLGAALSKCDNTGINAQSGNIKYVPDSSNYITYKKQRAMNANYNDLNYGGNVHNASYGNIMSSHR